MTQTFTDRLVDLAGYNRRTPLFSYTEREREHRARFLEIQVRTCLERWVSGLEPELVLDHESGRFLGLTAAGHAGVYVAP